jgi:hypothetical protein
MTKTERKAISTKAAKLAKVLTSAPLEETEARTYATHLIALELSLLRTYMEALA